MSEPASTGAAADVDAASVPTLNRLGRTTTALTEINERFVEVARTATRPVLDIGCAMGVAALAALEAGAVVHANDVDPEHLRIVLERAPEAERDRLVIVAGRFPDALPYDPGTFDAIHASNLLNFLTGEEIERGFAAIASWLAPGGVFLSMSGSPYAGNIRGFVPAYEAAIAEGVRWPGECADLRAYSDDPTMSELPRFLHLLDPDVLVRSARAVGLVVEEARFFHRRGTPGYIRLDGRENVVLVARRPL
ncbi:class I SAM-dependent methyltransferase [Salinarimonas chemoclinalis]|uniref:class I SAM-dependent methyltransferase n=1 Tax=Salinarimonas chemoclinalis TaxID=3241599 RepID=UPI003558B92F